MKRAILIGILGILLLAASAKSQGMPMMGECINSSYLRVYTSINLSGAITEIEQSNIYCPFGCNENADQYGADCIDRPVVGMMLEIFLSLFFISIASLIIGVWQKKWLFCMFSTILFLVLSFQGFKIEVISGGLNIVYQDVIIVLLCWFSGVTSFIFTLAGMLTARKDGIEKREMEIRSMEYRGD